MYISSSVRGFVSLDMGRQETLRLERELRDNRQPPFAVMARQSPHLAYAALRDHVRAEDELRQRSPGLAESLPDAAVVETQVRVTAVRWAPLNSLLYGMKMQHRQRIVSFRVGPRTR